MSKAKKMTAEERRAKYVALMRSAIAKWDAVATDAIKVAISNGNRKIGNVMNVSTAPLWTCGNCSECFRICYDVKANFQYKNVRDARARNTSLLKRDRDSFFNQIEDAISKRKTNKYFRWHVAGDIVDMDYFSRMAEIAKRHPDFVFWTYTKMYTIVNLYVLEHGGDRTCIPANLTIMFSEWRGMPMLNPYSFPEFRVVFKDDAVKPDPKQNHFCAGNCDICKKLNRGCIVGETTYCNEH